MSRTYTGLNLANTATSGECSLAINSTDNTTTKYKVIPILVLVFEKKNEVAESVNKKIIEKYYSLGKYIEVCGGNEQQLLSVLPKVEVTKFIEENRGQFDNLKQGFESAKQKREGLDAIVEEIRRFYEKMNFSEIASKYYQKITETNRENILEEIFSGTYKLITAFNEKSQTIYAEAKVVG
jgi:hypothetical protein